MQPPNPHALILFPGALGDFVCFLPTLAALHARHRGALCVVARPALLELIQPLQVTGISIDRREIADLFGTALEPKPETTALFAGFAHVYSWTGSSDPDLQRRLRAVTGGSVHIYAFRGMRSGEHAVEYYARCAGVEPHEAIGSCIADDPQWFGGIASDYPQGTFVVVHSGSGAARKNWQGFPALVAWLQERGDTVISLRGPVETATDNGPSTTLVFDGLTLAQVASLLRRARCYVGNDSGITHLAAAVGATTVALFGPTDPVIWAPRGSRVHVIHAPEPRPRCGCQTFCVHRLSVHSVTTTIERLRTNPSGRQPEVGGGRRPR